jgi:hypothetical protein
MSEMTEMGREPVKTTKLLKKVMKTPRRRRK